MNFLLSIREQQRAELVEGLNRDLAGELRAAALYGSCAARAARESEVELAGRLEAAASDELGHAHRLADLIVSLGSRPAPRPAEVPGGSDLETLLGRVQGVEEQTIRDLDERIAAARDYGAPGVVAMLRAMRTHELCHLDQLARFRSNRAA